MDFGGGARPVIPRDDVEPLTADLRRLHVTVSRQFLRDLEAARNGLSHAIPNATTEQVLQEALRLLLEKQARARGQVRRPRAVAPGSPSTSVPATTPTGSLPATSTPTEILPPSERSPGSPAETPTPAPEAFTADTLAEPLHRRAGPRGAIPAAVRRAVWARDGGRCTWPLDGGGCCGSTHQLELDHVVPWARSGDSAPANLRVVCAVHNRLAARLAFGVRCVGRYSGGRAGGGG